MSVKDYQKKIAIKGNTSPTPITIRCSDKTVTTTLDLWQLNLIETITESLENENGCQVWYTYMKD